MARSPEITQMPCTAYLECHLDGHALDIKNADVGLGFNVLYCEKKLPENSVNVWMW